MKQNDSKELKKDYQIERKRGSAKVSDVYAQEGGAGHDAH